MRQAAPLTMGWCLDCHRHPEAHLRPENEIFAMDWQPPPDQVERGRQLLEHYHIKPAHLIECSVCHR